MNQNLFCILYNEAKGVWVVVRESALSRGAVRYCGCIPMLLARAMAATGVLATLLTPVLHAQIVADAGAQAQNRPEVGVAGRDTPLVQIAAPNSAGLSNNHYTQFNVDGRGVILNNANAAVQTHLGGVVGANPHLAGTGGASLILNQVVGTAPSLLAGCLEVAGRRADVVVANPNGIVVNGGSFINVGRGVLTTALPIIANGGLEGFRVSGGQIRIGRDGLLARGVDQVDLIARSLEVNGQIRTDGALNVITGSNQVRYANLGIQVLEDEAGRPTVGIDVGELGGMYARKIHLVGTEKGVGVNSEGTLAAQGGRFTCTQEGRILLADKSKTTSIGELSLQAKDGIENRGALYALGKARLDSAGKIRNTGTLATSDDLTLRAAELDSKGGLGAGIDAGTGQVSRPGRLEVQVEGRLAATGTNLSGGDLAFTGAELSLAQAKTQVGGDATLTANRGGIDHQGGRLQAKGMLVTKAFGALVNDAGGWIESLAVKVKGNGLSNREGGKIGQTGTGNLDIQTTWMRNDAGIIHSKGSAGISATQDISNTDQGVIHSEGFLKLRGCNIVNDTGWITSHEGHLSVLAEADLTNAAKPGPESSTGGVISARGNAVVKSGTLRNFGQIVAGTYLKVQAKDLVNDGILNATKLLDVEGDSLKNEVHGRIGAPSLALVARTLENRGEVRAEALQVDVASLTNAGGKLIHEGAAPMSMKVAKTLANLEGGLIESKGSVLKLGPEILDNTGGTITGHGKVDLRAARIDNTGGTLQSVSGLKVESRGELRNEGGTLQSDRDLVANAKGALINTRGHIKAAGAGEAVGALQVSAATIDNGDGRIDNAGVGETRVVATQKITNSHAGGVQEMGAIHGLGNVTITSPQLHNTAGGGLEAGQGLTLEVSERMVNAGGVVHAGARLELDRGGAVLDNTSGQMSAGRVVSLNVGSLDNSGGQVRSEALQVEAVTLTNTGGTMAHQSNAPMVLQVAKTLTNTQGGLIKTSSTDLKLSPEILDNTGGTITHLGAGTLSLGLTGEKSALTNRAGSITTQGEVDLSAGSVNNQGGTMAARRKARLIATHGGFDNSAGEHTRGYVTGDKVQLEARQGVLGNQGGAIEGNHGVTLDVQSLANAGGCVQNLKEAPLTVTATGAIGNNASGTLGSKGQTTVTAASVDNTGGGAMHGGAGLKVQSRGAMLNQNGTLHSNGDLVADVKGALDNTGARIEAGGSGKAGSTLQVSAAAITNADGRIMNAGSGESQVTADQEITNTNTEGKPDQGIISGGGKVTVAAAELRNTEGGTLDAVRDLDLKVSRRMVNSRGKARAGEKLELAQHEAELVNSDGELSSGNRVELKVAHVDNNGGTIRNTVEGTGSVRIEAAKGVENRKGTIISGEDAVVLAGNISPDGTIQAGRNAEIDLKGDFTNPAGSRLTAKGNLNFSTTGTYTNEGKLDAPGEVTVKAAVVHNQGSAAIQGATARVTATQHLVNEGRITGETVTVTAEGGKLDNKGELEAPGGVTVQAAEVTNHSSAVIQGATTRVTATQHLVNEGRITGGTVIVTAEGGKVENKGGRVDAKRALTVTANHLENAGGVLVLRGPLARTPGDPETKAAPATDPDGKSGMEVKVKKLDNIGGTVRNLDHQPLTLTAGEKFTNTQGVLYSLGTAKVEAGSIDNSGGELRGGHDLEVKSSGEFKNGGGHVEGRNSLVAEAKGTLSNPGGRITVAEDLGKASTLKVTAEDLDNRGGVISNPGSGETTLIGSALITNSNQGDAADVGLITGQGKVTVRANELRNTQGGQITAGTDLTVHAVKTLDNSGGTTFAKGKLNLDGSAAVTNTQGRLSALGDVTLVAGGVDNTEGEIGTAAGGTGAVKVTTGGKVANNGRIVSGTDLTLAAGAVEGAGLIAGANDTTLTLTGKCERPSGNRILAGRNLSVTGTQDWKNAGSLQAPGTVTVKAAEFHNQGSGTIKGRILTVTGTRNLTNEGKARIDGEAVTLRSDREIVNQGAIAATGKATLTSKEGAVRNPEGTVSAQGDLEIEAAEIESKGCLGAGVNGGGKAVHSGDLKITATGKFKVNGHSVAGRNLTFTGPGLTLQDAATMACGDITLTANGGVIEHQGAMLKAGGAFRVTAASLLNTNGTIVEAGRADNELKFTGSIDNGAGTIVSNARNLTIASGSLNNGGTGRLRHAGTGLLKLVQAGELKNTGGTLSSNGEAGITAGTLNNEAGLVSAKQGMTLVGSQSLNNGRGTLEAGGSLDLEGAAVTNSGGRMVALDGQVVIKGAHQLDNAAGTTVQGATGGLISGSTNVSLQAGRINNTGGTIVANGELGLQDTKELNNTGTLSAGGTLKAHAGSLNNAGGHMTAATLDLQGSRLDNSGGTLTGEAVSGSVTDLFNSNGQLTHRGTGAMALTVTGALTNTSGGQIRSNGNLSLKPQTLDNSGGTIAQAGRETLAIEVGQGKAELVNASGTITSMGAASVVAGGVNNTGGSLRAGTVLDLRSEGAVTNLNGLLDAQGSVTVRSAGDLNNAGGRIQAAGAGNSGYTLLVTAASLDNAGGRIANADGGDTTITATGRISNSNISATQDRGVIGGQGSVTIRTPDLQNLQDGQLVAGQDLTLDAQQFTNTGGKAHAQANLSLEQPKGTVANAGGEISAAGGVRLSLSSLANTDGRIVAGQDLVLTAPTLPVDGTLSAGRDATFTLQGDFTLANGKTLSAGGNLTLNTTGTLTNAGNLEAVRGLTVGAANITNQGSGLMCGETAHVTTPGTLANFGRIFGGDIALGANQFINGERAVFMPWLRRGGPDSSPESKAQPGTVAAGRTLQIGAQTVSNQGSASLLAGMTGLAIGGRLDDKHQAVDSASRLINSGATIQSMDGDMHINATVVNNLNPEFQTVQAVEGEPERLNLYQAKDHPVHLTGKKYVESELAPAYWGPHGATGCWYSAKGDFSHWGVTYWEGHVDTDVEGRGHFTHYQKWEITRTVTRTQVSRTTPGQILAGGNLYLKADKVLNDQSRIIAGRDMPVLWTDLRNTEKQGQRLTEDRGITYDSVGVEGGRANYPPKVHLEQSSQPLQVSVSERLANTRRPMQSAPDRPSSPVPGPLAVPAIRLSGNTGPDSIPAATGRNIQRAETGQPQTVGDADAPIPNLRVPEGGLYQTDTSATAPGLVVTHPKFLRGQAVKGLDHMLENLKMDPQTTPKRMGDGYYETQLVSQQILDLTGRPHLLPDSNSANGEFVALMDNGLSVAGGLQLKPGTALTDPQKVALPKHSVWPVQQQATLPDGNQAPVLVPVVYPTKEKMDKLASLGSAVISAETLSGTQTGDLKNSGTLMADRKLDLTASGIHNTGEVRTTGADSSLTLHAQMDLLHEGGIQGVQVELKAGQDLTMRTGTNRITGSTSDGSTIGRVATVNAETLATSAGRDLRLVAAQVRTAGAANFTAARDAVLDTVATGYRDNLDGGPNLCRTSETAVTGVRLDVGSVAIRAGGNLTAAAAHVKAKQGFEARADGNLTLAATEETRTSDVACHAFGGSFAASWSETTLAGNHVDAGSVAIRAGGDLTAAAADLRAKQDLKASAGGNVNLTTAEKTYRIDEAQHSSGGSWVSSWSEDSRSHRETHTTVGNLLSGNNVDIKSGGSLSVEASTVVGDQNVVLAAEGNVEIKAATNHEHTSSYSHRSESGLLSGGGLGFTIGRRDETHQGDDRRSLQSQSRSQVGSVNANVAITSANAGVQVSGSDLAARQNLEIKGRHVTVGTGQDETHHHERHEFRQTGLTVSLSSAAVSQAQGIVTHVQAAADHKGDGRAIALNALASENLRKNLAARKEQAKSTSGAKGVASAMGVQVSASFGTSRSESESTAHTLTHLGSTALAGADLRISAIETDLESKGSAFCGENVTLEAVRHLKLTSAVGTSSSRSRSSASSASLGVSAGIGSNGVGFSVDVALSASQGHADGDSATHLNQGVLARKTLELKSGADTQLKGVQASGNTTKVTVRGNLSLETPQDTFHYASSQQSTGLSASIPLGFGRGHASLDISQANARGDYRGARQQTAIRAGSGGYQMQVDQHLDLKGAVIDSSAPAERNSLTTRTMTISDVHNQSSGSAESSGLSLGTTMLDSQVQAAKGIAVGLLGRGDADRSDASTTFSDIDPGSITITDDQAQQALTGLNASQTLAQLRRTTQGTEGTLALPDMANLEDEANRERTLNTLAVNAAATCIEAAVKNRGARKPAPVSGSPDNSGSTREPAAPVAAPNPGEATQDQGRVQPEPGAVNPATGWDQASASASSGPKSQPSVSEPATRPPASESDARATRPPTSEPGPQALASDTQTQVSASQSAAPPTQAPASVTEAPATPAKRGAAKPAAPKRPALRRHESSEPKALSNGTDRSGQSEPVPEDSTDGPVMSYVKGVLSAPKDVVKAVTAPLKIIKDHVQKAKAEAAAVTAGEPKPNADVRPSITQRDRADAIHGWVNEAGAKGAFDRTNGVQDLEGFTAFIGESDTSKMNYADFHNKYQEYLAGHMPGKIAGQGILGAGFMPTIVNPIESKAMGSSSTMSATVDGAAGSLRGTNVVKLSPSSVRLSQSSVNGAAEITEGMRKGGWAGEPIDVVRMPDKGITTIDNTRVVAAKRAGIEVQAVVHEATDAIPAELGMRFAAPNGKPATTWGEAVQNRIQSQARSFREKYPNGSHVTSSKD